MSSTRAHPSAEELYGRLKSRCPSLSLATVYKTLRAFERVGLASLVNAPHVEARYDAITEVHHHAICERCGRIADLFDRRLNRLRMPSGAPGFRARGHSVHFYGLCARCSGRKDSARQITRRKNHG